MNSKTRKTLFSSSSDEWSTPKEFVQLLEKRLGKFELDPCATEENAVCDRFYSKEQNGLSLDWKEKLIFVNPPYSEVSKWVEKACEEYRKHGNTIAMLIPARTDTKWWHKYIMNNAYEINFIKGRLKFSNAKNCAPFPSVVIIFAANSCRMSNMIQCCGIDKK